MQTPAPATALLAVLVVASATAEPLPSADELRATIENRATQVDEYRALLKDADQSTRLAALEAILRSDNGALRELAYHIALTSDDDTARAVALKHKIGDLKTLVIMAALRDGASEHEQKVHAAWGGTYAFLIENFNDDAGTFNSSDYEYEGEGQITGTTLSFSHRFCNGTFTLGDGGTLSGTLGCRGKWQGQFTGTVQLD